MTLVPTREYTDPAAMLANYARIRRALYAAPPAPVTVVEPGPEPSPPAPVIRDHIRDWLALAAPASTKPTMHSRIMGLVAERFDLTSRDLASERRTSRVMLPRQICCYVMRQCTVMSLSEIGARLGGRDHTTILSAVRKIDRLLAEGRTDIRAAIDELVDQLNAQEGAGE